MDAEGLYRKLIEPIEEQMMATVGRLVRDPDDAADVFQDTLATVWSKLAEVDRHPNPHGYVLRVCISRSYDLLRRRRRRKEVVLDQDPAEAAPSDSTEVLSRQEQRSAVLRTITELPRNQALSVLLRAFHEASFEEVAEILGCATTTARSHFSKGIARLRELLDEIEIANGQE